MPNWRAFGTHRFYREGDLVYFEVSGPFTLSDAQFMHAESESAAVEYGYILAIFDNRNGPGMTAEARRYSGMRSREINVKSAIAIIGASMPVRVMTQLVMNVARLAGKPIWPLQFFATPAGAMAWITLQRQELCATPQSTDSPVR